MGCLKITIDNGVCETVSHHMEGSVILSHHMEGSVILSLTYIYIYTLHKKLYICCSLDIFNCCLTYDVHCMSSTA